jgi:hypothetical protein
MVSDSVSSEQSVTNAVKKTAATTKKSFQKNSATPCRMTTNFLKAPPSAVIEVVTAAYKSLKQPDFAFVKKTKSQRPYETILRRLRDYAAIEENIDTDDDVCFSFLLKGRNALWKLDLSMIGPFAIFVRLKSQITEGDFLHTSSPDLTGFESKIVEILTSGGIRLMHTKDLQVKVPLKLFNTPAEQVSLYQALFTDRPELPWQ